MFRKKTWADRISEYPTRRILTDEDGTETVVSVARSEGVVSQEGDPFNAETMNEFEDRIQEAFVGLITSTILAGETELVIEDDSITENSIIDVYFRDKILAPTKLEVTAGKITIEIDTEDTDTEVGVRVL